jgi:hypothetical protein
MMFLKFRFEVAYQFVPEALFNRPAARLIIRGESPLTVASLSVKSKPRWGPTGWSQSVSFGDSDS